MGAFELSAIRIPVMPNKVNGDSFQMRVHFIQNPVFADAKAIGSFGTFQFAAPGRKRILRQFLYRINDLRNLRRIDPAKVLLG
jgi:hypothetical protein